MGKLGSVLMGAGLVSVAFLLVLRMTGLDPEYVDYTTEEYNQRGRTAWPGLWLTGEVVQEPVEDWDWTLDVDHPELGNTIMLETRAWYGLPHSVTILPTPRGDKLYIGGSARSARLEREFPFFKTWWANVERDPRVRLKIDGKIYEMTAALVNDPEELAVIIGRRPITKTTLENGSEEIIAKWYYWRVFQRNVVQY